ncbi:MAG: L-fucose/L-arabinose isomerase family protein [candidate division WOR-3 bacterium]|nr:L-fucose/L-arabinose isomerase family protein [candidate division WOR-3 bacterium]
MKEKKDRGEITFGLIVGNRGFFPDTLVEKGREEILEIVESMGYKIIVLSLEDTKFGAVETREDAKHCASLFSEKREEIDGILVTLPNFGDEKAIAESIRLSGLNVPVLVHGFSDEIEKMGIENRRDAFCGKISVCNNLNQYGITFTNTTFHVESPGSTEFKKDLENFADVCRVVEGMKNVRLGAIGTRTAPFNTVRYSEKILEREGVSVETIDLSQIIGKAKMLDSNTNRVREEIKKIKDYISTKGIPDKALDKIARLSLVIKEWVEDNDLDATAIQCWPAIEEFYGVVPCTVMSMMTENFLPSACEVDIMGALSMYALQLASCKPAALTDWNNNYGNERNKAVTFHCSNLPASFFESMEMGYQNIIAGDLGKENTYGTCVGKISSGPATFLRLSTDDVNGQIISYLAEGNYTDDQLHSFGAYGVVEIENLQELLKYITAHRFEHHVAITKAHVGEVLKEAIGKYLKWELYNHNIS